MSGVHRWKTHLVRSGTSARDGDSIRLVSGTVRSGSKRKIKNGVLRTKLTPTLERVETTVSFRVPGRSLGNPKSQGPYKHDNGDDRTLEVPGPDTETWVVPRSHGLFT